MQIPGLFAMGIQNSFFQEILQQCSKPFDAQQSNHEEYEHLNPAQQILHEHRDQEQPHLWILMDQAPFESILQVEDENREDTHHEYHRVKSLREEQEYKIRQFLRDDRFKSLKSIEAQNMKGSPVKQNQSLSPKKTKRIDKRRSFRLFPQSD